jgi:hypothetical protein
VAGLFLWLLLRPSSPFALARSPLPFRPNFPGFARRPRLGPIVSKIFLAAIPEPDLERVGDLLFLIGGEPIVEGQCLEAFASAGGVVVGVPVAAGDSNATADFFDEGVAFEGMVGVVGLGHGAIRSWGLYSGVCIPGTVRFAAQKRTLRFYGVGFYGARFLGLAMDSIGLGAGAVVRSMSPLAPPDVPIIVLTTSGALMIWLVSNWIGRALRLASFLSML